MEYFVSTWYETLDKYAPKYEVIRQNFSNTRCFWKGYRIVENGFIFVYNVFFVNTHTGGLQYNSGSITKLTVLLKGWSLNLKTGVIFVCFVSTQLRKMSAHVSQGEKHYISGGA